ncbi:MAG: cupin domain-containing protein [Thermoplasmata archaeon]
MAPPLDSGEGWAEIRPGARQKVLVRGPEAMMMLYEFAPNRVFPAHVHPLAQMGFVLEGSGRHTIGGEVRRARAGDSYYIPAGIVHDFRSDREHRTLLVDAVVATELKDASTKGVVRMLDGALVSPSFRTLARPRF